MVDGREMDAAEPGEPAAYRCGVQRPAESAMLEDLLQNADLQQLFDLFHTLINIPVAVIDLRANTLISTRSQRICAMFHRVHPLTCSRCIESDRDLANQLEEGKIYATHQCGNGLTDCASPIVIDGKHVANLFIGPFLTETPEEERFRKQAKELGCDKSDYLAALHEVPVVTEEKIAAVIDVLVRMTGLVIKLALDRKRALESQSRQSIILDTIPQSVFWKDVEGRYLGCNTAFAKAVGCTPEEVLGKTDFDLPWARGEAEAYRADDLAVISQQRARLHILESVRQGNGSRLLVDTSKVPLMDALGNAAIGVLGIFEDVTERKRTEQELDQYRRNLEEMVESRTRELNLKNRQLADEVRERSLAQAALKESGEKYRTLINQSSSIVLEWDPDGVVLYLNPYGLGFFGFAAEEIIGRNVVGTIVEAVDSSGVNLKQKMVDVQNAPDTFYSSENENLCKDGKKVWVAWTNRGVYGPDGQLIKIISFGIDRTEQRATEQRLHAQYQQLQQEIVRRERAEEKLRQSHAQLEERVLERVKELTRSNERLTAEVAERKRAEMALVESEEQYRSLISAMNEGVTLQDETSAIIAFNQSAERILGLTADQLSGKTSFDPNWRSIREDGSPFPSETHPVVTTLRTGLPQSDVIMGIHKPSGELTWISVNARPIFKEGSKTPYRVVATMHDITERKCAEEELRGSEERFRTLSDNAMVGVNIIQDGRLVYVNPAFAKVFGYQPGELIGVSPMKVIHPDDQDRVAGQIKSRMSGEQPSMHYEFRGRTKNGDTKHIEVFSTRIVLNNQPAILANLLDITERKQAELALRTINRHLRALSACNEFVVRAEEERALLEGICKVFCEVAGYRMAWVGYAEQDEEKIVRPVVWAGAEQGYLFNAKISWADTERGGGPTGIAIRHAETVCIEDFETDPRVALWRESALNLGYRSSIALPLRHGEAAPFGVLSIYSSDIGAFSPDEVHLLEQLATDLAFGIGVLRDRAEKQLAEEKQRESETRFRAAFMTGAVAFFILEEATGRVLEVNDHFLNLYGYPRDEVIGRASLEIGMWAIPEDLARLLAEMERNDRVDNVEVLAQRKGGEKLWVLYSFSRLSIAGPPLILGAIHDITARKEAESRVADYVKQLESTLETTLQAVSTMVEIRDPYTAGHERRVGVIAADIAREMGWSEDRCHRLHQVGLVHDIGKIALPAEILTKPARLSAIEFELVKEHAERGWEILKMVKSDMPIGEIVRQHHERMDGSGYPRGLKGDEIMPEARILAVADVLESMASHRPYRPTLGVDAAVREIESGRGTKFDEQVVDALLALINDKGYRLPE